MVSKLGHRQWEKILGKWRHLKTISNWGFASWIFVQILDWYNADQLESVMYDPVAKAYWRRIQHLYEVIGWTSASVFIGCLTAYWLIEYIYDRRNLKLNRGH